MKNDNQQQNVPFRGGGFSVKPKRWTAFILFVALIIMLEIATRTGLISTLTLPRPSDVFYVLVDLFNSGVLWQHLLPSITRLTAGASVGVTLGVIAGIAIGLFSSVRAGFIPFIAALFPVPKIALLPLFVIWFGIGEASKHALIAFGTFTPTVVATYGAVDNIDRTLVRMGQGFSLSWFSIVRKIVLPASMPGIFSGLRIGLSIGIIILVAMEMLGAEYGMGAYILEAGSLYHLERLFAGVVILSLMGVGISTLISILEKRVLKWRVSA